MKKLLEIKNLSAGYDGNVVLDQVSLDVFAEDFIGIIGPNGGGKTTLIKTLLGLVKPISGTLNLLISKKQHRLSATGKPDRQTVPNFGD